MRLVQNQHRVQTVLLMKQVDVSLDGLEEGGGSASSLDAEGEADLAIEVAAPERNVGNIDKSEMDWGEASLCCPEDRRFPDSGLTSDEDVLTMGDGVQQMLYGGLAGLVEPQGVWRDVLVERVFFEADNKVRLQPRNEKYSPIVVDGKRINGLYRAVTRIEVL